MEITSINNERVKKWLKLKNKKYRDSEKLFLIEDDHLIKEALSKGLVKEIITVTDTVYDIDTYYVTDKIMNYLSDQVSSAKTIAVCYQIPESKVTGNAIILDNIQDPGNLGTIIRSAVAFNFKTIILSDTCVDLYNSKVIRASEGMIFHINVIRKNLVSFLKNLDDYTLLTTDVFKGQSIKEVLNKKSDNKLIGLVIGNEGHGVSSEVANLCQEFVNIKMNSNCESLNAGVCASILMYEVDNYE